MRTKLRPFGVLELIDMVFSVMTLLGSYKWNIILEKCRHLDLNVFHLKWTICTHGYWNSQNSGGHFVATSYQPKFLRSKDWVVNSHSKSSCMDIRMTCQKGLQPFVSNFVEWMHFKVGFWHGLIEACEMSCQVSSVLTRYLLVLFVYYGNTGCGVFKRGV